MPMLERETCERCGVRVATFDVVDADGRPTGGRVVVDRVPSLHGYYRRPTLLRREVAVEEDRTVGLFRPHHETCTDPEVPQ